MEYDDISDLDLGEMFLWKNKALVVRSSTTVLFFKYEEDKHQERLRWILYHQIRMECSAFIAGSSKNANFQIV